jgi:hypothetical protein
MDKWAEVLGPLVHKEFKKSFKAALPMTLFEKARRLTAAEERRIAKANERLADLERGYDKKIAALMRGESVRLTKWEREQLEWRLDLDAYED